MAYIVADPCVKCKFTDCVAVCPVDCFYEGTNFLAIHPEECIDCGACEPECPATAIFEESELPPKWNAYIELNAVLSGAKKLEEADCDGWPQRLIDGFTTAWPQNESEQRDPLPDAEALKDVKDKIDDLDLAPYEG